MSRHAAFRQLHFMYLPRKQGVSTIVFKKTACSFLLLSTKTVYLKKVSQNKLSRKSVHFEPRCWKRRDRQTHIKKNSRSLQILGRSLKRHHRFSTKYLFLFAWQFQKQVSLQQQLFSCCLHTHQTYDASFCWNCFISRLRAPPNTWQCLRFLLPDNSHLADTPSLLQFQEACRSI
jgi:hypothetical protein